jgi:diguanylate cyclase (GGDEF)-like protein/PAS domain S-box-containing protein
LNVETLERPVKSARFVLGTAQFPDKVVEPFTRLAAHAMGAPICVLFAHEGDKLLVRTGTNIPQWLEQKREIAHFFEDPTSVSMRLMIDDVQSHELTRDSVSLRELGWRSVAVLQFGVDSGSSAVLCVADTELRKWSTRDRDVLTDITGLIVMQVRREMRAREEMARQRTIEEARRQIEERFRRMFENSRDAIYMTSRDGRFTDANPSMFEMFGYKREELLQMNADDLYADPQERTLYQQEIDKLGFVRQHEIRLKCKDGTVLNCLKTATVQRASDGSIVGYQSIVHDISERKRAEEELAYTAFHDTLTGVPNRALFMDRLERVVRAARRRPGYRFGVLFLDLDRFKIVNDTLGHMVGDQLLVAVARRLEGALRVEDTVARFGGDEFAIILDSIRDAGDSTRVAERIIQDISVPFIIEGKEVNTGTSVGVALSYSGDEGAEGLLRDADAAMYRAKASGRGRYEVFDPAMHTEAVTQLQIEADLRRAVQARQFALVYQPIIDMDEGRLAGFEAFLRWQHPSRGVVAPGEFISVAEQTGLILPIGWWAFEEACRQIHAWELEYPNNIGSLTVSVNLSMRQFYQPDLVATVEQILGETGSSPARIALEITEMVIMKNAETAAKILKQLSELGVLINIDDFGTGFSSFSYLHDFPVTTMKIDRKFVSALNVPNDRRLVNSILAVCRSMGVDALAEGVETKDQMDGLRALGTRYAQGYYFSYPVDPEQAAKFIQAGTVNQAR